MRGTRWIALRLETSCDILCGGARKLIGRLYSVGHAHVFQLQDASLGVVHLSLARTVQIFCYAGKAIVWFPMLMAIIVSSPCTYRQKQDGELLRHSEWGTIFAVLRLQKMWLALSIVMLFGNNFSQNRHINCNRVLANRTEIQTGPSRRSIRNSPRSDRGERKLLSLSFVWQVRFHCCKVNNSMFVPSAGWMWDKGPMHAGIYTKISPSYSWYISYIQLSPA